MKGEEKFSAALTLLDLFAMSPWSGKGRIIHRKKLEEEIEKIYKFYHVNMPPLRTRADHLTVLERCQAALLREVLCGRRVFLLLDLSRFLNRSDVARFLRTVRSLQMRGASFLLLEHDWSLMLANAQTFLMIRGGVTQFIAQTREEAHRYLSILEPEIARKSVVGETHDARPVLDVRWIGQEGETIRPFQLHAGEVAGVIDPSSYRSDRLFHVLKGSAEGIVFLNGKPYRPRSMYDAIHSGVGFVLEKPELDDNMLNENMTVSDNLLLTMAEKPVHMTLSRYRSLLQKRCREFFGKDLSNVVVEDLDLLDRQKLIYLRWLLYNPSLLVCYHPFSGANPPMRRMTENMINLLSMHGVAVLIISNRLGEIYSICTKTIFLS
jgi:ABC-type sugar transport system ATPase subunit